MLICSWCHLQRLLQASYMQRSFQKRFSLTKFVVFSWIAYGGIVFWESTEFHTSVLLCNYFFSSCPTIHLKYTCFCCISFFLLFFDLWILAFFYFFSTPSRIWALSFKALFVQLYIYIYMCVCVFQRNRTLFCSRTSDALPRAFPMV